ncbi:MAG TPA: hypothetical protein VFR20_00075 [Burkholderiaceae bacterium]|nr:hypothetical protein [Burkholderiaceae bacterium]
MNDHTTMRLEDHRADIMAALLVFELLAEEGSDSFRECQLIELGQRLLGAKLELLDNLLRDEQGERHE